MPSGDIYELNVDGLLAGQNLCNVHHFVQVGTDGTGDGRAALMTLWNDIFKPVFLDCLSSEFDMVQYGCRQIKPVETQSVYVAATGSGDILSTPMPNQVCAILRQYATPLLRRGTGHVKMSGLPIVGVVTGRLTVAQSALLMLYGAKMVADQTESGSGYVFRSGVYSQQDSILRPVKSVVALGPTKTCYSRSIGVGS